jgi:hypothetical protein
MEVVRNKALLARISPDEVEAYLQGTGWQAFDADAGRASYWRRTDERSGEDVEVVCLRDPTFRDYAERTSEMLGTVSSLEQRSPSEVYESIASVSFDVAEMHIERSDANDGFIPLKAGAHAFQGALKMYAAAAAAEIERKAHFGNLLTGQTSKFVSDSVRLGQTKLGSYVITVATRLPSTIRQSKLALKPPVDDPFERRVMRRLATALGAARDAAIRDSEEAFQAGVQHGVSADLCDAVSKMAEGEGFVELNISLRWSWLRPEPPLAVSFGPELVRNLRAGGAHLRFRKPMTNFHLVGQVIRLEHFPHEENGTIGVLGFVGLGEPEDVAVTLNDADYKVAVEAHQTGVPVVCVGELKRDYRGYALLGARNFTTYTRPLEVEVLSRVAEPVVQYGRTEGKKPPKPKKKPPVKK